MATLKPFQLTAVNLAKASENKMHDDAVAKTYGFEGGLVPGVTVFGYLSHPAVARWGRAFLERGLVEATFVKPVYDGDTVVVAAEEAGDSIDIEVVARETVCATVTGNYERKGHRFVELDGLVVANRATPIAHCQHTAIYQPRGARSR